MKIGFQGYFAKKAEISWLSMKIQWHGSLFITIIYSNHLNAYTSSNRNIVYLNLKLKMWAVILFRNKSFEWFAGKAIWNKNYSFMNRTYFNSSNLTKLKCKHFQSFQKPFPFMLELWWMKTRISQRKTWVHSIENSRTKAVAIIMNIAVGAFRMALAIVMSGGLTVDTVVGVFAVVVVAWRPHPSVGPLHSSV